MGGGAAKRAADADAVPVVDVGDRTDRRQAVLRVIGVVWVRSKVSV
jgi:hypothetical protein